MTAVECATEPHEDQVAAGAGQVDEAIQEEVDRLLQALEVHQ